MRLALLAMALFIVCFSERTLAQEIAADELFSVKVTGIERQWRLFIPAQYNDAVALPLVLNFHGTGSSPLRQSALSDFETLATEKGFVVASPQAKYPREAGGPLTWNVDRDHNGVDDVLFVLTMIEEISIRLAIDPKRIYATGFSGGARMSSRLACDLSDHIAAIGPIGGIRYPEDCRPLRPMPVIAFHGKKDKVNHYEYQADSPKYWRMGVEDALEGWVANNGCREFAEVRVLPSVTRVSYRGCEQGAELEFYRSDDAGHTWPGSPLADSMAQFSKAVTNTDLLATRLIWDFFERHSLN